MSTSQASTSTCKYCNGDIDVYHTPGYCTEECYLRDTGQSAINILKHDHRLCANCGRWLKEVEPPSEDWKHNHGNPTEVALSNGGKYHNVDGQIALDLTEVSDLRATAVDCMVGFQYRTENAITVEKEFEGEHEHSSVFGTGTGCVCGSTDGREVIEELQDVELATVLSNYVRAMWAVEREGQTTNRLDKDAFFQSYKDTRDLEYSLGKGLE